jgi:hypothetical protein
VWDFRSNGRKRKIMPKKDITNEKNSLPKSEEHLREVLKNIRSLNDVPLETRKKEASIPLYLVRYE